MKIANRLWTAVIIIGVLAVSRASAQTLTTLHSFTGDDGSFPAALIDGGSGVLYGTTEQGGASDAGTVFKLTTTGVFSNLYVFTGGNDGAGGSSLELAGNGELFGSTEMGGVSNGGTIFEMTTGGLLMTLDSFTTNSTGDPASPGFIKGTDGNFYGGTSSSTNSDYGTIFKLTEAGTLTTLHQFSGTDGSTVGGLCQAKDGNLYGVTSDGGSNYDGSVGSGYGTFFKMTTSGGSFTNLYLFTNGADGANPHGLIQGADGNFYGVTSQLTRQNTDTVFRITAAGALTTIHTFNGLDGRFPDDIIQATDNSLYGTTTLGGPTYNGSNDFGNGTVYRLIPSSPFQFTTIYAFTNGLDGTDPLTLIQASDGQLYGTTIEGGIGGSGTVYQLNASISGSSSPTIGTGSSLPGGTVGASYNTSLAASGGTTPYTWSITSGSLPSGLGLVASSGAITGTPTVVTTASFTAKVTDHNGQSASQAFSLAISPAAPTMIIALSGNLAFGNVTTDTTATATLTITNSGNATLTVSSISYPTNFSGAFSGTIPAGGSQNVTVTFAPTALGLVAGAVTVVSDATGGTVTINVSGTGVAAAAPTKIIGLSGNLVFGNVTTGTTAIATLTITNSGNTSLMVTNISYPLGYSGVFNGAIPAGGAQNVTVTFAPPEAVVFTGLITVFSDATGGTNSITVSGNGVAIQIGSLTVSKMKLTVDFAKTNEDAATLTSTMDLGAAFLTAGQMVTINIGGAKVAFTMSKSGTGTNGKSTCHFSNIKKTTRWTLTVSLKDGSWQSLWDTFGLTDATIKKPGAQVTLPVTVAVDNQLFQGNSPTLEYTATEGKSGTAK